MSGNIIDKARERIERQGWTQGQAQSPSGQVCLWGSLQGEVTVEGYAQYSRAWEALVKEAGGNPIAFNDDPSTTLEDVILVMKKASARLQEGLDANPSDGQSGVQIVRDEQGS